MFLIPRLKGHTCSSFPPTNSAILATVGGLFGAHLQEVYEEVGSTNTLVGKVGEELMNVDSVPEDCII
jgi:hypothetical protein